MFGRWSFDEEQEREHFQCEKCHRRDISAIKECMPKLARAQQHHQNCHKCPGAAPECMKCDAVDRKHPNPKRHVVHHMTHHENASCKTKLKHFLYEVLQD